MIRSALTTAAIVLVAATAPAADPEEPALAAVGVPPDRDAVIGFLTDLAAGKRAGLPKQVAAELVANLASRDYAAREQATRTLMEQLLPPVALLKDARRTGPPEQVRRAGRILAAVATRPDPVAAALRLVRRKKWDMSLGQLIRVAEVTQTGPATDAAHDLLAERATAEDETAVRGWLTDKNPKRVAAAGRVLPLISKADATADVRKLLDHADDGVRYAAARGLAEKADSVDFQPFKGKLSADAFARLLTAAEWDFRTANAERVNDPAVKKRYGRLLEQYAAALLAADGYRHERKQPNYNAQWVKLGLDTSARPDVILYKVKWFNGGWSEWLSPGFGDVVMARGKPDPRNIRCWGCFDDHEYEVILATGPDRHRTILDVKQ